MVESIIRRTFPSNPEVAGSVFELRRDIAVKMMVVTSLVYLTWHFFNTVIRPVEQLWDVWAVSSLVFTTLLFTWYLLSRRYIVSQIVWHTGLFLAVTVAAFGFQDSSVFYLYILLPFSLVITLGWPAGLLIEILLALTVWIFAAQGVLPLADGATIVFLAAGLGLISWAIADTMLTIGEWYVTSFIRAQNSMEEIRVQRIQLAQVIKNLDQAYYRLQRTNADLVAAWKVAAEAERMKTEFATHISHELRTPLNLIAGFSEMMMTSPENYGKAALPGAYRRDLNTIYRSARHLLDLVDDVIDLARLDAGRLSISREEVDLALMVQESAAMVRSYIEAKGLDFDIDIQPELPYLRLDRLRIRQVLLNLLVNATRFTDKGSIRAVVARHDSFVRFSVSDSGRGIHPDTMENLFAEFSPGESTKDGGIPWHSGSGLGLPISKKFVDLHHGRMVVESELGKGTTIWFELPIVEKEARAESGDPLGPEDGQLDGPIFLTSRDVGKPEEQRLAVLLHPDRRLPPFLQRHLPGWRVQGVKTAQRIHEIAAEMPVSAVLVDSHEEMPSLELDLPVVACPLPSDRRLAQGLGVQAFLSKPVTREDLFEAIDRLQVPVRRVLIVDDDAEMVNLLQRMLIHRVQPQDCLEANNGVEALAILQREQVDLMLLDLMMPEMEGRELLARLRADPELGLQPIIVISALEEPASELVGALRIHPPVEFSPARMLALVKNVLDTLTSA